MRAVAIGLEAQQRHRPAHRRLQNPRDRIESLIAHTDDGRRGAQAHHASPVPTPADGDTVEPMTTAAFQGPLYGDDAQRRDFA